MFLPLAGPFSRNAAPTSFFRHFYGSLSEKSQSRPQGDVRLNERRAGCTPGVFFARSASRPAASTGDDPPNLKDDGGMGPVEIFSSPP
jgi:hypothetical protein